MASRGSGGPAHHLLDVYDVELHLATTRRQWATLRRRIDSLRADPDAAGSTDSVLFHPVKGPVVLNVVLFIDAELHDGDVGSLVGTVAHEADHAASFVLHHVGQDYSGPQSEAHAYLVGWIAGWIWRSIDAMA